MGACANAPMAAINDDYYEDLTPETLSHILDEFRAGRTPAAGLGDRPPGLRAGRRPADPDRSRPLRRLARQAVTSSPTRRSRHEPDGAER